MWDERYSQPDYAYGTEPNDYFQYALQHVNLKGQVLFAAEGEGRNAVYAAKKGIEAVAFDISQEGRKKAYALANQNNVTIDYRLGDFMGMEFAQESFDGAVLIYAHFPPSLRKHYHQNICSLTKSGGYIILEGFSKNNLSIRKKNPAVGGPDNLEMLFSKEMIHHDFPDFEIIELEEKKVTLKEGLYHNGEGWVIRFLGKKV